MQRSIPVSPPLQALEQHVSSGKAATSSYVRSALQERFQLRNGSGAKEHPPECTTETFLRGGIASTLEMPCPSPNWSIGPSFFKPSL